MNLLHWLRFKCQSNQYHVCHSLLTKLSFVNVLSVLFAFSIKWLKRQQASKLEPNCTVVCETESKRHDTHGAQDFSLPLTTPWKRSLDVWCVAVSLSFHCRDCSWRPTSNKCWASCRAATSYCMCNQSCQSPTMHSSLRTSCTTLMHTLSPRVSCSFVFLDVTHATCRNASVSTANVLFYAILFCNL